MNAEGSGATVSAKIDGELLEQFDEWWGNADEIESRSEALRQLMRDAVGTPTYTSTPLAPPTDDETLEYGYRQLCRAANKDGIVREETALQVCCGGPRNLSKDEVKPLVLHKLADKGYLRFTSDFYGTNRIKLNGWNQ